MVTEIPSRLTVKILNENREEAVLDGSMLVLKVNHLYLITCSTFTTTAEQVPPKWRKIDDIVPPPEIRVEHYRYHSGFVTIVSELRLTGHWKYNNRSIECQYSGKSDTVQFYFRVVGK